jgi:hypothetical protein
VIGPRSRLLQCASCTNRLPVRETIFTPSSTPSYRRSLKAELVAVDELQPPATAFLLFLVSSLGAPSESRTHGRDGHLSNPPLLIGLLINGVAYAAVFILIALLVARFTSQRIWRWFLLIFLFVAAGRGGCARRSLRPMMESDVNSADQMPRRGFRHRHPRRGPDRADNRTSHDVRTARLRDHDHREG